MAIRILQLIILLSLTLVSCKTTKYTLNNLPEDTITIGDGGGFAGIETGYTLLANGQVFRYDIPGDTIQLTPIRPAKAKEFYEKFQGLRLHRLDIEYPGNLYYFIKFTDPEIVHDITWGAAGYNVRSDILDFYKSFKKAIKNQKEIAGDKVTKADKIEQKKKEKEEVTGW